MAFSLFGLVLGLSLVEVVSGISLAIKRRRTVPPGYLTPLLAIYVLLDVTTFWGIAWTMRELVDQIWHALGFGLLVSAMYYVAAAHVFPEKEDAHHTGLDEHFDHHFRLVIGLVLACNVVLITARALLGHTVDAVSWWTNVAYFALGILTIAAPGRKLRAAGLFGLIAILVWVFVGPA